MTVVIALATDAAADPVLETGLRYAGLLGVPAHVVNVATADKPLQERTATPDELADLQARVAAAGVPATVEQVCDPDAAGTVLARAAELDASLIVIGVRKRSPVGKLLLGSVSQSVILESEVPVLAVKP
ncbi:universal stress protein [Nocardioides litoris]|uniref:universal stress protein n=1 Tax=Nocardioides litoris TaxID=1926648 RepID=UPI0011243AC5|nr:universal stress protein [Nocardioides litoris]